MQNSFLNHLWDICKIIYHCFAVNFTFWVLNYFGAVLVFIFHPFLHPTRIWIIWRQIGLQTSGYRRQKNKNWEHFSRSLSSRPRFLIGFFNQGWTMIYQNDQFKIKRYCEFLRIGFYRANGRYTWLPRVYRADQTLLPFVHVVYWVSLDKWW